MPVDRCPLCGSLGRTEVGDVSCSGHPLWRPGLPASIRWFGCDDCDHVYTADVFDDDEQQLLFADSNVTQRPGHELEAKRLGWASTVRNVAELQPSGRWLDVGFGDGAAMFVADEFGFDVTGIDVRSDVVDSMAGYGYAVEVATVDDVEPGWDVVSMFDTLEHVADPVAEVRRVFELLEPGGVFALSCPNMGSTAWETLDAEGRNPYWAELEHYHNFTRERLAALLVECGFRVVGFDIPNRWRLGMEMYARRGDG